MPRETKRRAGKGSLLEELAAAPVKAVSEELPTTPLSFGSQEEFGGPVIGDPLADFWQGMDVGTQNMVLGYDHQQLCVDVAHDQLEDHEVLGAAWNTGHGRRAEKDERAAEEVGEEAMNDTEGTDTATKSGRGRRANSNKRKATEVHAKELQQSQSSASKAYEVDKNASTDGNGKSLDQSTTKKHQLSKDAAMAKADRERKRRERLNKCFDDLALACVEPYDSSQGHLQDMCKTDRMSIIVDAIKVVKALRIEVNQLRQLNKFMTERVEALERGRVADVYQSSYSIPGRMVAGPSGAGPSGMARHDVQATHGVHFADSHPHHPHHVSHVSHASHPHQPEPHLTTFARHGHHHQPCVPANEGMEKLAYLPPSNLSEDGKLRPPAA